MQALESDVRLSFLPKDPDDDKNVILEVRAGKQRLLRAVSLELSCRLSCYCVILKCWEMIVLLYQY